MKQWITQTILELWLGREQLTWFKQLDWSQAIAPFQHPALSAPTHYPEYYRLPRFHGIDGGYLSAIAAITYDPVTQLASPPNERWLRQQLVGAIQGQPEQILDLGCGTGSSTVMLKQAFPNAAVTGLDLSPYMLVMAHRKAQAAQLDIPWHHGLAEATPWKADQFDVIAISFLFHEMPPVISQQVLRESRRLLKPGGQIVILDGSQRSLRHLGWLIDLFREPYSRVYAAGCVQTWLENAGFGTVKTRHLGLIHQLTVGTV